MRKLKPPLSDVRDSVGVCVTRTRADVLSEPAPASFLAQSTKLLHKGKILDIAAGRGRNALYLGGLGFAVDAVDRNEQSLEELAAVARQRNLTHVTTRAVDLETDSNPLSWANESYDAVIVFYYLHRPLFPHLLHAVRPGGMLIYETFLIDNHLQYQHPRRKEFCLMFRASYRRFARVDFRSRQIPGPYPSIGRRHGIFFQPSSPGERYGGVDQRHRFGPGVVYARL